MSDTKTLEKKENVVAKQQEINSLEIPKVSSKMEDTEKKTLEIFS